MPDFTGCGNPPRDCKKLLRRRFSRFLGDSNNCSTDDNLSNVLPLGIPASHTGAHRSNVFRCGSNLIQSAMSDVFSFLYKNRWESYIVGGTLRDLMIGSPAAEEYYLMPRDVDIIVVAPSVDALERAFPCDLIQRRTRFGGLHLVKKLVAQCEIHFDVWPLKDTWAIKQYGIEANMSNFPRTPFLNIDSAAIELFPTQYSYRRIFEHEFCNSIEKRLLDINFEPNPYPDICAIRSLIIAAKSRFALSRRLAQFILARTTNQAFEERWRHAQISHYGRIRCQDEELYAWLESIDRQLIAGEDRIDIPVSAGRQMTLWMDHPPQTFSRIYSSLYESHTGTRDDDEDNSDPQTYKHPSLPV